jgi:uncharacterized protein with HEPN domain
MNLKVAKRLHDALVAARLIGQFVEGRTFASYLADVYFRSAVERQFEILSEALNVAVGLDQSLAELIPEISQIVGMRNRIAHSYDRLDDAVVWQAATQKVPDLADRLQSLLDVYGDPSALD